MEILGKKLSEKTAVLIGEIEQRLSKPVVYNFTDPNETSSYGQCDPWQPDAYYVYVKESLLSATRKKQVNIPFETNLLHELSHLCQIEEGFPFTNTKDTEDTRQNIGLYNRLGSLFASSVLDLNVDFRLKEHGYTSEFFNFQRWNQAEKAIRTGPAYNTEIDFIQKALSLFCLNLMYTRDRMDRLLQLYNAKAPNLVNCINTLSADVRAIGYDDPEGAFRSLVYVFSAFDIFATHAITFRGKNYPGLASVRLDYPDIHTAR